MTHEEMAKELTAAGYKVSAPELPPKPSQEWIDYAEKWECDIIGWSDKTSKGDLCGYVHSGWGNPNCKPFISHAPFTCTHDECAGDGRWILRKRAPAVKPWTLDKSNVGKLVERKDGLGCGIISGIRDGQFVIPGWGKAPPAELLRDWTCDGGPCGEVAK